MIYLLYVSECFARMNVHHVQAWCPQRSIEGTEYLGTGVMNSYWAAMWFLGTKPEPSTRKTNTLSFWVISLARVLVGRGAGQKSASGGISQELATATMAYMTGVHLSASLHWGMGVGTPGSIFFFFVQSEIKIYFYFSTCRHPFSWHYFVGETVFSSVCFWRLCQNEVTVSVDLSLGPPFPWSSSLYASFCYCVSVLYNLKSATPTALFLLLGIPLDVWSPLYFHFFLVIRILMRIVFNLLLI